MHIQLAKSEFQKELGLVQAVVERKHTIPILSYVRLQAQDGKLEIAGTDIDVGVQSVCEAEVREAGTVCLPARKLFDLVRALADGPIEIEATSDRATIRSGRSRFRLAGLPVENFPDIPDFPESGYRTLADWWVLGIRRVIFATTEEELRYAMSGVHLEWWEGGIRLVATDGHRLALWETAEPAESRRTLLVPKKTMQHLLRLIEDEEGDVEFAADSNHVYFRVGGRELVSRLLTGQFPNYELVIPKEVKAQAVVSAARFHEACRRVAILADERVPAVRLGFSKDRVVLTARPASSDEEAHEELECSYEGEPMEVTFNAEYLQDFFRVVEGDVEIGLVDGQSPARLRPLDEADGRYIYVVMPMRLG